jgi:hypothetical protein
MARVECRAQSNLWRGERPNHLLTADGLCFYFTPQRQAANTRRQRHPHDSCCASSYGDPMKFMIASITVLALVLLVADVSEACVYNVRSLSKRRSESRNVFVGALVNRTQESENGRTLWRNQFLVDRFWKGTKSSQITICTTLDDCAPSFESGQKYLVFAYYVKESNHLETESCMGTGRVERVGEDLKLLGRGKGVGGS